MTLLTLLSTSLRSIWDLTMYMSESTSPVHSLSFLLASLRSELTFLWKSGKMRGGETTNGEENGVKQCGKRGDRRAERGWGTEPAAGLQRWTQEQMTKSCLLCRGSKVWLQILTAQKLFCDSSLKLDHTFRSKQTGSAQTGETKPQILHLIRVDTRGVKTRELTWCNYVTPWSFQQVCVSWWSAQLHNAMTHSLPPQGALASHHWRFRQCGCADHCTRFEIARMRCSYSNIFISILILIWCVPLCIFVS